MPDFVHCAVMASGDDNAPMFKSGEQPSSPALPDGTAVDSAKFFFNDNSESADYQPPGPGQDNNVDPEAAEEEASGAAAAAEFAMLGC